MAARLCVMASGPRSDHSPTGHSPAYHSPGQAGTQVNCLWAAHVATRPRLMDGCGSSSGLRSSGRPWAAQRLGRRPGGLAVPGTGDSDEQPRVPSPPGAAELAGAANGGSVVPKLPDPIRGDGLGNHRVHDILLGCRPPFEGVQFTLFSRGTTVSRRKTHRCPTSSVVPHASRPPAGRDHDIDVVIATPIP